MKELNEEYLQQRIEKLEEKHKIETNSLVKMSLTLSILELKQLLANCKKVETHEAGSEILYNQYLKVANGKQSFLFWLEENNYKLIKAEQ